MWNPGVGDLDDEVADRSTPEVGDEGMDDPVVLRSLLQDHPALEPLLHEAHNSLFAAQARREASLLGHSPAERYQAFRASHAHLEGRLPLHHVARYLGVTNVSLSRIRARLGLSGKG